MQNPSKQTNGIDFLEQVGEFSCCCFAPIGNSCLLIGTSKGEQRDAHFIFFQEAFFVMFAGKMIVFTISCEKATDFDNIHKQKLLTVDPETWHELSIVSPRRLNESRSTLFFNVREHINGIGKELFRS